jgi:hypothetical protein
MIVAYAGRRAQALVGGPEPVAARVRRLLMALKPTAVVGAAADGADLIVLEAALALPAPPAVVIVLPTSRALFAEDSVEPAWRDRFEAVLDEVTRRDGTVRTLDESPGEAAYRRANQEILRTAADLAVGSQRAVALVVAHEGEGEMVEDLLGRAQLGGMPMLRIDPSAQLPTRPRCFIAMPFGRKTDVQRRIDVDCNLVYAKILVPALENAQLNYRRADEEIDSGIVLEPMIEWIAEADLVIGDLGTGNFNVGWELGLRHLLRPGQTLLVGPAGTTAPFDLAALRHVRYRQDEKGVSDDAAVEAWANLAPFLARSGTSDQNDSPVAAVMEVQRWPEVRRRSVRGGRWDELRDRLALARDLRDADQMRAVLDEASGLSDEHLRLLRAEVGVGLVRLGRFEEAQPLLREIVDADTAVQRPDAYVYYAQALYRPPGAPRAQLDEAQQVLTTVLVHRPGHPEVRALLGAVAKRRLGLLQEPGARQSVLRAALEYYRHDAERNLNRYYEGVNVVGVGTVLALTYQDEAAGNLARELLPAVRVAARIAAERPDERYWAAATVAECALCDHLLNGKPDPSAVRSAYRSAGALRPLDGDLASTLAQLEFLTFLGLPVQPLAQARAGLLEGAGKQSSDPG